MANDKTENTFKNKLPYRRLRTAVNLFGIVANLHLFLGIPICLLAGFAWLMSGEGVYIITAAFWVLGPIECFLAWLCFGAASDCCQWMIDVANDLRDS